MLDVGGATMLTLVCFYGCNLFGGGAIMLTLISFVWLDVIDVFLYIFMYIYMNIKDYVFRYDFWILFVVPLLFSWLINQTGTVQRRGRSTGPSRDPLQQIYRYP